MWFGLQLQRQPWARAGSQLCHSLSCVRARTHSIQRSPAVLVAVHWSLPLSLCLSPSPILPLTHSTPSLCLSRRSTFTLSLPFCPLTFFFFMTAHISKPPGFLREPHVQYTEIVQPSGTSAAWLEKQREHGIGGRRPGWQRHPPPTLHGHQQKQKKKTEGWDHRGALAISPL